MLQTILDGRLQIAQLPAAIVTLALEFIANYRLVSQQISNRICELNFPARAPARTFQFLENGWAQQIATHDRERRRCILWPRLLDNLLYAADGTFASLGSNNAIL